MKEIKYHVALKSTEHPHRYPNDTVYTNDRESVQFVFTLTDFQSTELSSATAKIYLFMKNGSMYQEDATVVPSSRQINYTMQGNQGKHYGQNRVQIELIIGGRTYASPVYYYTINPGLESQVAQEVMIRDWTALTTEARALLVQIEVDEAERVTAEEGRESAEQDRVEAESQRINDFSSKADQAEVDEIKAGSLRLKNLITNGDFSQGTASWYTLNSTLGVTDGVMSITGNGGSERPGTFTEIPERTVGNKYYYRLSARVTNDVCQLVVISNSEEVYGNPVQNQWFRLSGTREALTNNKTISIQHRYADAATSINKVMEIRSFQVIDLTDTFGAGNEPTAPEMDKLIDLLGGWFDGEIAVPQKTLASWLLNEIHLKADKQQEEWIEPTLLNGWVQDHPVRYMKNDFGFVKFMGAVKSGDTNTVAFILPVGYRPSQLTRIPIHASGGYGYASISTTGHVYIVGTTSGGCFIDSLSFEAV